MDIKEHIELLRNAAVPGTRLDHKCTRAADTMEKLLAVYEATERVMAYPDIRQYMGSIMAGYIDEAIAAVQTTEQGENDG